MNSRYFACVIALAGGLASAPGISAHADAAALGLSSLRPPALAASVIEADSSRPRRNRSAVIFPVAGRDPRAVVGYFGDRRDGGRRWHRGVDIAAPRGTAVLAVVNGWISRVEHTAVGGRVVWLRDAGSDREHYFAHLDAVTVTRGQRVRAGTQIGTVGNTGNAARTPPHLHYAVYEGSSVLDPMRLLGSGPEGNVVSASKTGAKSARTKLAGAALKSSASNGHTVAVLPKYARVEVIAEVGRFARVRYRGVEGYMARWLLERT